MHIFMYRCSIYAQCSTWEPVGATIRISQADGLFASAAQEEDYDAPHVDVDAVKANLKAGSVVMMKTSADVWKMKTIGKS